MNEQSSVLGRATISFQRPIDLDEGLELLKYLAAKLPARVNYNQGQKGNILVEGNSDIAINDKGSISLEGMIVSTSPFNVEGFSFLPDNEDYRSFAGFQFNPLPRYASEGYQNAHPTTLDLFNNIRNKIQEYFTENPPSA